MNTDTSTTNGEANAQALTTVPVAPVPVAPAPATPTTPPTPVLVRGTFVKGQLMDEAKMRLWGAVSPKGKMAMLGAIAGTVTGIGRGNPTPYDVAAGREDNIWLEGDFVINNLITGEETEATKAYVPRHYMDKIDRAFTTDTHSLTINCELGIEATGKPISYAWVVVEFDDSGRNEKLRRELRERSKARKAQNAVFQVPVLTPEAMAAILAGPAPQKPALAGPSPALVELTPKAS